MYEFIDVNETSEGGVLPSEALQINGEYIENQISGYRTLNVQGREALSPDVVTFETGVRDGSKLRSKKYPERIITVTYQLKAESSEAFREAYNKLAAILDVEEAELIFNDEQDKFFIGTPCIIGAVAPGLNAVVGEFEILCADPFKYSVLEYEARPDLAGSSILIDYNGTYKAYPTLEAEFYNETLAGAVATSLGDCGYVAFFNENEKIIQLGDPEEKDTETYPKSQTLAAQSFKAASAWGSEAQSLWSLNDDTVETIFSKPQRSGDMAIGAASYVVPFIPETSANILTIKSEAEAPTIAYKVVAKTSKRTADTVKVTVTVTASLAKSSNYFGTKRCLKGSIQFGNEWYTMTIKKESEYWRGNSGHSVSTSFVVKDLDADTTELTDIKFKVERTDDLGKTGILDETKCADLRVSKYIAPIPETYYLTPTSYGAVVNKWHGPSITRTIPADASGEVGAKNFTLTYSQKMGIGGDTEDGWKQEGAFWVFLTDANDDLVAGLGIRKTVCGNEADVYLYVGDKSFDLGSISMVKNKLDSATTISKSGKSVRFTVSNKSRLINLESIKDKAVTKITFAFEQVTWKDPLTYNGLYWVKFAKDNCDTYSDIPNKFSTNDIVEADCKNGKIFLNGASADGLGALGNDWEEFYLTPGLNQIGFSYSDWVDAAYAPTPKVKYREVFL